MILYQSASVYVRDSTSSTHRYSFGFVCDKCNENTNISDTKSIGWISACCVRSHVTEIITRTVSLKLLILLGMWVWYWQKSVWHAKPLQTSQLTLQCQPQCIVGSLTFHPLPASVHCMVVNTFKSAVNLKCSVLSGSWNLNPSVSERLKEKITLPRIKP
jgi:hypothetical protein